MIETLRERYVRAERLSKEVGNLGGEVVIAAHNELRNAGYHLLTAIDKSGCIERESKSKMLLAIDHCERAEYDAAEAGIIFCLDTLKGILTEFRDIVISDVITDIAEIRMAMKTARDTLDNGRTVEKAVAVICSFRKVRSALEKVEHHYDDLVAKSKKQNQTTRRFIFSVLISVLIGVAGLLVAVL